LNEEEYTLSPLKFNTNMKKELNEKVSLKKENWPYCEGWKR